jgi:hypothetical protein
MAPRGWGRTSYRIVEVIRLGMTPVYVYSDIPWLPYYDSIDWSSFAIVVNVTDMDRVFKAMAAIPIEQINKMRDRARSLIDSHFSIEGAWQHLRDFLRYGFGRSDLRCAPYLPE